MLGRRRQSRRRTHRARRLGRTGCRCRSGPVVLRGLDPLRTARRNPGASGLAVAAAAGQPPPRSAAPSLQVSTALRPVGLPFTEIPVIRAEPDDRPVRTKWRRSLSAGRCRALSPQPASTSVLGCATRPKEAHGGGEVDGRPDFIGVTAGSRCGSKAGASSEATLDTADSPALPAKPDGNHVGPRQLPASQSPIGRCHR